MTIKIKIGEIDSDIQAKLNIRKSLDGNLIISDHEDIDIVFMPEKAKIITFNKDEMSDKIYDTQNRLFKYLSRKGVIKFDSIRSGNVYGSLEGTIPENEEINSFDAALLVVSRWLEDEKPYYMYKKAVEEDENERLLDPGMLDSTELGEIPNKRDKMQSPTPIPVGPNMFESKKKK